MRDLEPNGPLVRPMGVRRFSLAALAAVLLVLSVPYARADTAGGGGGEGELAQTDNGLSRLIEGTVHPGFDGRFVPGRAVPVKIELAATQLLSGEVQVVFGGQSTETVAFEISADTSEAHWVLVDGPLGDAVDVRSSVRVDGRTARLDPSLVEWDRDAHLLGTLPGVGAGGPPADGAHTRLLDEPIHFVDLEPGLLDLGPMALAALDSIAATADDLDALPATHRRAVLGWLADGGTLYLDSSGPIEGWPSEYESSDGIARAGAATVVMTDGQLAAGHWDRVVLPSANRSIHEDGEAAANVPWGEVQSELFNVDLGRDLPALSGLLAVLGVYILVVGPITYLVLRGRAMARWVAVPVLAVLATGVVFINGDGLGTDATAAVIDVVEFGPGTATATSKVLLAGTSGQREISAPSGWTAEIDETMGGFGEVTQRRHADGVRFSIPAPAGGVGYLGGAGPVEIEGALEVSATAVDDGKVTGTVRNTLDVTLDEVAVFAGRSSSTPVGTLEPGAEASFELVDTMEFRFGADPFVEHWGFGMNAGFGRDIVVGNGGPMPPMPMPAPAPGFPGNDIVSVECDEFGNCTQCDGAGNCFAEAVMGCDEFGNCPPMGFGPGGDLGPGQNCDGAGRCRSAVARPGALTAALRERGANAMSPGLITAVGWTSDLRPVLDLGDGVQVSEIRTAVVARAVPDAGDDRLVDAAAVRSLVGGSNFANDGLIELVFRFALPPGGVTHPDRLRIDVPEMFVHAAILTPSGDVVARDPESRFAGRSEARVPAEAILDGHVFVRGSLPFEPPPPGRELVIYETWGP